MVLVDEIELYIIEVGILDNVLTKSRFIVDRMEGTDAYDHYVDELPSLVDEYNQTVQALLFLFEQYFDWEKKNKTTSNLRYRRIYKELKSKTPPIPPASCPA